MRVLFFLAVLFLSTCLILPSCNTGGEGEISGEDSVVTEAPPNNILPFWGVDIVSKTMKRDTMANWHNLIADSLISGLNERNPEIRLQKTGLRGDTIFLSIKDAYYLTEELGSSGAIQYMSDVVLNLTAVPGINYVSLDFAPGDHASPGTFGKKFVAGFKEVIE